MADWRDRRHAGRPERGGGRDIPYKPAALEKKKANFASRRTNDPEAKCYMPGIPRANYMPYPFQIVQSPRGIMFVYEFASANRLVNMGKPEEAGSDTWMGTNNGHWEGDTLVIDVTGLNGLAWFDRAGDFASKQLHVVERFSRPDPYHLNYEATIEDPIRVHAALEDQHAALSQGGKERTAPRVQVRGVRRRVALRTIQEAAGQIDPRVAFLY